MRKVLFVLALSCCFVVMCACTFLGVRMGSVALRALVVFVASYAGGLVAALVIFVTYFSDGSRGRSLSESWYENQRKLGKEKKETTTAEKKSE